MLLIIKPCFETYAVIVQVTYGSCEELVGTMRYIILNSMPDMNSTLKY